MKVITWNVNNRLGVVSQQVQVHGQREPDIVALQDVNVNAVSRYIEAFHLLDLPHVLHTRERQHKAVLTGVLLASRIEESTRTDCDVQMDGFLVLAPPCALHTNHHPAPGFPGQMHHETGAVFFYDD